MVKNKTSWSISRVSCQKGPTRHAYAWQIRPFWQDTQTNILVYQNTNIFLADDLVQTYTGSVL